MALSSTGREAESIERLIEFARGAALQAQAEAENEGSTAYFEVGGEE
jgi:hypothetical protein